MPLNKKQIADLETNIKVLNTRKAIFAAAKADFERISAEIEREIEDLLVLGDMTRYVGKRGEALLIETPHRKWQIDKLEETLTVRQFKLYCPPTPSGKVLSAYRTTITLDAAATRKLDACCELTTTRKIRVSTPEEVEARAKKPETESKEDAE